MICYFRFRQWMLEVNEGTASYNIYNHGSNGERQFYEVVPGKYGEPIIVAEPEYAFDVSVNLCYVNAKGDAVVPDQQIAGIICQDGPRFSLTNAKNKGVVIRANEDGSIQVGEEKWWLATLFLKDKNRFRGYDAYCVRQQPEKVRILELGDLNFF